MIVLFVVRSIGYGGASKQLALTANALASFGHNVYIYSYNWKDILQKLVNVTYLPESNIIENAPLKEYLISLFRIRKQIKRIKPDVVITWRVNAGFLGKIAAIGTGAKVIFSERTDPYMESSRILDIAKKVCDRSDGGVFQTPMARDYYKRLAPKSVVIPNPFTYKGSLPGIINYDDRKKEIAVVGRFSLKQKRQDVALKAFEIIHETLPDYKLAFYGDGDDFEKVKLMAFSSPIRDQVLFKGSVNNVIESIRHSKLLLLTSDYEGIPNVILEAFAAGTPVVSTDCSPGGARILIEHAVNGFIVDRGDTNAISEKTISVISDTKLARSFIIKGRKKLQEFTGDKIFHKWNDYVTIFKK